MLVGDGRDNGTAEGNKSANDVVTGQGLDCGSPTKSEDKAC